ncbi:succinyldiaminopimelate transaminase [Dietzia sp.]|uniref:succinyldiaminopimelate transaminase n=1 Tax=Dietzia sp. TaxID=1871616 RepID=UPI002FD9EB10
MTSRLPVFPWDTLAGARSRAAEYPVGLVDLTVGAPVDEVDPGIRAALAEGAAFPGYPATHGTAELRSAAAAAMERRFGVPGVDPTSILPVIGTKEIVAGLPAQLDLGAGSTVVIPEVAYPTYEVGALLAGARAVRADSLTQLGPEKVDLVYINSPSNPTGKVLGVDHLRKVVGWARERGAIVASDECYLGLVWEGEAPSILDPRVCDGDFSNLLALHSLSKSSSLAGYRAGFVAGDPELVAELLAVRKHAGMIVPMPVQTAMTHALTDDAHVDAQRERYRARRALLAPAVESVGLRIENSEAGLYLWASRDEPGRATVDWFAERGILVAPGEFYGPRGEKFVRIALTATDEAVAEAARRLER